MSTDQNEVKQETGGEQECQGALLLELENVMVDGRKIAFDVVKGVLADQGVILSPTMYSRYCVGVSIKDVISALMCDVAKKKGPEDKLQAEVSQGIKLSLSSGSVKVNSAAKKLIDAALERKLKIGFLSESDEATAESLVKRTGVEALGQEFLVASKEEAGSPGADAWLKLSRQVCGGPGCCAAIVTSASACQSALAAGLRCVVVPDAFTEYQDFGGADIILDSLGEESFSSIFGLLE